MTPKLRLFDPGPTGRVPIRSGRALVPLSHARCPDCGSRLVAFTSWQPALFIHGDYGATVMTEREQCLACGWALRPTVQEVNPRPFR